MIGATNIFYVLDALLPLIGMIRVSDSPIDSKQTLLKPFFTVQKFQFEKKIENLHAP